MTLTADPGRDHPRQGVGRPRFSERLAGRVPGGRLSAGALLGVYVVLLFGMPARLVVPQIGAPGTPANLWAVGLLFWWVCARVGGLVPPGRGSAIRTSMGWLLAAVLVSYVAAMTAGWYAPPDVRQATDLVYDYVPASVPEIRGAMVSAADRGLIAFAGWLGVVLVAIDGVRSRVDIDRTIAMVVNLGVFLAVVGIIQYFTGFDISVVYQIPGLAPNADFGAVDARAVSLLRRVQATATGAIEYGVVLGGVFPFALHRSIFAARDSLWRWAPPLAIILAAALSISRSAVLVLGAAAAVLMIGWPSEWRRRAFYVAPVAVVAVRLVAPGVVGTLRALFLNLGNDNSITGRTEDYAVVLEVFGEHPWVGRGLFTFVPRYYRILDNQFLMTLLELGLIGTIAFVAVWVSAYRGARSVATGTGDAEQRHLGLALSASLVGIALSFATFDAFTFPMAAGLFFVLVGLAGATSRVASPPGDEPAAPRSVEPR